ncbi:MAG: LiaF transmembrane domain-containing protein [Eubacteriales bacterium]
MKNNKKFSKIIWGAILVGVGVVLALNAFGVTDIDIFFDGWWTLFIIVPCAVALVCERNGKTGSFIGLIAGIFLLLACRNVIGFDLLWKLLIPAIVIIIGIKLIFGGVFRSKHKYHDKFDIPLSDGENTENRTATFSAAEIDFTGREFCSAELNAVFGSVKCDIRSAVINKDCTINATAVFGGIDIMVPENINVRVNSNSVFGGVSDKKHKNSDSNQYTLYVNANCMFGGVDIK